MDLEIDSMCCGHAKGEQVPISKGGERVRSRVALPDGTAVLVKYDTKITSPFNGSIKIIRRDKTVILAEDGGVVRYSSSDSWGTMVSYH